MFSAPRSSEHAREVASAKRISGLASGPDDRLHSFNVDAVDAGELLLEDTCLVTRHELGLLLLRQADLLLRHRGLAFGCRPIDPAPAARRSRASGGARGRDSIVVLSGPPERTTAERGVRAGAS